MPGSKTKFEFIIIVVIVSILCANIAFQLDIDFGFSKKSKFIYDENSMMNMSNITITDSPTHIMWFLQISDIHLSIFVDPRRVTEFKDFCITTVNAIKPAVVLATGDLTDAKHRDNMGSAQYKQEWVLYSDTLNKCEIRNKTIWLDIRGNHDNFNVPGWESLTNYFRNYSIQGPENPRSYMHMLNYNNDKYAFIGIDACLEPGPKRPFNFIGILESHEIEMIKSYVHKAEEENIDHIIWFGHYPSSCIISTNENSVRNLIGNVKSSKAYLCGHLHQMGGLITEMYTLQKQGYLELELGDWKDNRMFRLAAIDHGLFSFVDIKHGEWPVILITNPKHALHLMADREPFKMASRSSHIRLLVFSLSRIETVRVKINDNEWVECKHKDGPLYTIDWNPDYFSDGLHLISAKATDIQGREKIVTQPFSLDGTKTNFKILAKTALMLNAVTTFQFLFGTMIMVSVLPLVILRYIHHKMLIERKTFRFKKNYFNTWLRGLWILSSIDDLFYPLVIYEIYITFGPWSIGEIMDDHIGVIFAWGIILRNTYLPGAFTYAYGFAQMLLCQFPLTLTLARIANNRYKFLWITRNKKQHLLKMLVSNIPFIIIIAIQMTLAYFFWLAYGTMAVVLCPLRTWSIFLNFYLWYKVVSLSASSTREVASIWTPSNSWKK